MSCQGCQQNTGNLCVGNRQNCKERLSESDIAYMQKEHRESCFTFQINPICGECPQYEECMKENGSRAEKDKAEAEKILNARAWEGNAYVKVEQTRGHLEDCLVDITIKLPGVEITLRNVEVDIKRKQT